MLKETDDYLSGQEICERLNVSRTAVWKVIKQLETEGYEIEAVRNRGYRLRFLGDILSQAELESSIDSGWAGKNILYFDETDSTNTEIKKAAVRWQSRIISRWERDAAEEAGRRRMASASG